MDGMGGRDVKGDEECGWGPFVASMSILGRFGGG
jgi:hypothetical protein